MMNYIVSVFLLSGAIVGGLTFTAMAVGGLLTGKVYHTAGCSPIVFRERPVRFVLWMAGATGIGVSFLIGAAMLAAEIIKRL